jgi:hypothetical protein
VEPPLWDAVQDRCGQAFAGKIISNAAADDAGRAEEIIMHLSECSDTVIRIPLHVGDNHSRTWILTKLDSGFELRHDHRHEDGSEDAVSQYGGASRSDISALRQEFPADAQTKAVFDAADISVSNANVWAMEYNEFRESLTYEMARPNRDFRIEFSLGAPVPTPPAAWGQE